MARQRSGRPYSVPSATELIGGTNQDIERLQPASAMPDRGDHRTRRPTNLRGLVFT